MTPRIAQLRRHIHDLLDAGVRRTVFYDLVYQSLRSTVDQPAPIRRARAFGDLLDRVEQVVLPHELVAGSILGLWPLATGLPTYEQRLAEARTAVETHLRTRSADGPTKAVGRWALMGRDHYEASIAFPDLQRIARELEDELGDDPQFVFPEVYRVLENLFTFQCPPEVKACFDELPWFVSNHLHLNYDRVLRLGLGGLRDEIRRREAAAGTETTRLFYTSTLLAVEAAIRFIRRYGDTLRTEAGRQNGDRARAAELGQMAEVCDSIAEDKPADFRSALQLVWMLHTIANLGGGSALSFARFDQYLFPFFERDWQAGVISPEAARELIACVWLKINEPKMRTVQSLCLSGLDRAGLDGTNELTYLCLEVAADVKEPYPNTAVRMHQASPEQLWEEVTKTLLNGIGQPMIFSDDAMLPGLIRHGYPAADARDYYPMGCVEIMLQGVQPTYQGAGSVLFPGLIELVLNNGRENYAGETGAATGELSTLTTFESFLEAFLRQVDHRVRELLTGCERRPPENQQRYCDPFASALVGDCLEKGLDICQGGARYPRSFTINSMGLGTAVDSLSAIRSFVYERQDLPLPELKRMLDENFAGYEPVRQLLASRTPAFGNDLEEVDDLAVRIYRRFVAAVDAFQSRTGAIYMAQMFSYHSHVYRGEMTAATPDGRRRGTAFSDGTGPAQGKDTHGPTALLNSMTRLDYQKLSGGCGFNMKISPSLVRGTEGANILQGLLRTYLRLGGLQIQVNLLDQETLRRAQRCPEEHRDIIVRVAGYCEYFTSLDAKLQDEIIQRTSQEELR